MAGSSALPAQVGDALVQLAVRSLLGVLGDRQLRRLVGDELGSSGARVYAVRVAVVAAARSRGLGVGVEDVDLVGGRDAEQSLTEGEIR